MTVLCIGDSLTYGYGVAREDTWCAIAARLCGHEFVNRGVNGATTGEMLEGLLASSALSRSSDTGAPPPLRDADDLPSRRGAVSALFVMGGLNDLFMGMAPRIPLAHIRAIVEHTRRAGLRPVVGIPSQISADVDEGWCDGPIDMDHVRASYADFAAALRRQCEDDGVAFIDFRSVLGPADLAFDGIHLNRQGHRRMAEAVAAHWEKVRA